MCLCSLALLLNGFTLDQTGCLGLGLNGRGPAHCQHASSVTRTLLNLMVIHSNPLSRNLSECSLNTQKQKHPLA